MFENVGSSWQLQTARSEVWQNAPGGGQYIDDTTGVNDITNKDMKKDKCAIGWKSIGNSPQLPPHLNNAQTDAVFTVNGELHIIDKI